MPFSDDFHVERIVLMAIAYCTRYSQNVLFHFWFDFLSEIWILCAFFAACLCIMRFNSCVHEFQLNILDISSPSLLFWMNWTITFHIAFVRLSNWLTVGSLLFAHDTWFFFTYFFCWMHFAYTTSDYASENLLMRARIQYGATKLSRWTRETHAATATTAVTIDENELLYELQKIKSNNGIHVNIFIVEYCRLSDGICAGDWHKCE